MNYAIGTDTGMSVQAKRRSRRKPAGMKLLQAVGDTYSASERLRALQDRAVHMRRAEAQWQALPTWRRVLLTACGYTPVSFYEGRA